MPVNSRTCPRRPRHGKQVGRIFLNKNGHLSHVPDVPDIFVSIRVRVRERQKQKNVFHLETLKINGTSGTVGQEIEIIIKNPSHLKKTYGTSGTD